MTEITSRFSTALADRYKIERRLGEGGMATVYLAEDLKHERKVAVKVLKPELAAVLGAERFVQEIKTTANLQHPHILPLFDSGAVGGPDDGITDDSEHGRGMPRPFLYYVMPFIDGETLRDKLNHETQLGIEEAVSITTAIADALDYAHRNNVIHRDIKPENILLHEGRPMVADFGIALAVSAAAGGRMTETGLSLGTPHYMSPEQATAEKDLTARSDIYSLGSMLYEMLTGTPPHLGGSAQQIIMKIVTDTPRPVTELRKSVPPHVAAATAKSLEKLAADRFATAGDFGQALNDERFGTTDLRGAAVATTPRAAWRRGVSLLPWLIAAVAVVMTVVLPRAPLLEVPTRRFDLVLEDSAPLAFIGEASSGVGHTALAISRNGSLLAYVGSGEERTRLYLRSLEDGLSQALAGTEGAYYPFFSPDGAWVGFFAGGVLKKVSVATGQVIALAATPEPYGADWGPNGEIVVNIKDGAEMILVPEAGGSQRSFLSPTEGGFEYTIGFPRFLPGGDWVLGSCFPYDICVRAVETGDQLYITKSGPQERPPTADNSIRGLNPRYVGSGHLIYGRPGDGVLAAVAFDVGSFQVRSAEVQLMQGIRREGPITGRFQLAISEDGTLVWAAGGDASNGIFVWVDESGALDTLGFPRAQYNEFDLADDRRWLAAVTTSESGQRELRVFDLLRGDMFPWRDAQFEPNFVSWGPTSQWLLLTSTSIDGVVLRVQRGAPTGGDTVFNEGGLYPNAFLDDTTLLALRRVEIKTDVGSLFPWRSFTIRVPAPGDEPGDDRVDATPTVEDGGNHLFLEPSPDGVWISYTSNASGPFEVYVVGNPIEGPPIRVSRGGGELGMWSADSQRLYYRNGRSWYYVERTGRKDEPFSEPQLFLRGSFHNVAGKDHAVSADGRSLLLLQGPPDETARVLHVVTNWFKALRDLVPENR